MAEITVDNVKTKTLLDHGVQVSIAHRELLPKVRETQGWTIEQHQTRNLTLSRQPVGAIWLVLGNIPVISLH